MYTVSIYNQRSNSWRSVQESTLSACVQLTIGLATQWLVSWSLDNPGFDPLPQQFGTAKPSTLFANNCSQTWTTTYAKRKYQHALRSLLCRWVNRYAKSGTIKTHEQREQYRFELRLSDSSLHKSNQDELAQWFLESNAKADNQPSNGYCYPGFILD